ALVGILTAIDSIKGSLYSSFASMGANSFSIRNREMMIFGDGGGATKGNKKQKKVKTSNRNKRITWEEASEFKRRFAFPAVVSLSFNATGIATVYKDDKKTNPNVQVIGADENYLELSNYVLEQGRNFNDQDLETGRNVALLGHDVAVKLFGRNLK